MESSNPSRAALEALRLPAVPPLSARARPWIRLPADPGRAATDGAASELPAMTTDVVEIVPENRAPVKRAAERAAMEIEIEIDAVVTPSTPSEDVPPTMAAPAGMEIASLPVLTPVSIDLRPAGAVAGSSAGSSAGECVIRRSRKAANDEASGAHGKIRLFVFGDTGTGKTLTGLSFPRPLVIDLEAGTDLYEETFDFSLLDSDAFGGPQANDWHRLNGVVDYLIAHPEVAAEHDTLVIDPFTVAWEACQEYWGQRFLARRSGGKGHKVEFYDLQPGDWRHVKGDLKSFFRRLKSLPLHIVATAREKPLYAEGEMMRKIGETFDGERNLPYFFDLCVRLRKHPIEVEVFEATIMKARNFFLPRPRYVYRGATGFYEVIAGRLAGESDPQPSKPWQMSGDGGEAKNGAELIPAASAPAAPHPSSIGFDGHVEIEIG